MIQTWTLRLGILLLFTTGCDDSERGTDGFKGYGGAGSDMDQDVNSDTSSKTNSDTHTEAINVADTEKDASTNAVMDEDSRIKSDSDADSDSNSNTDASVDIDAYANIDTDADNNSNINLVIEEEAGFCFVNGSVDANNSGYTGIGFANTKNAIGAAVQWAVAADGNAMVTLEWMFANGGDAARPGWLIVNGTTIGTVDLPPTGGWSSWDTVQQGLVELTEGDNSIRLEATTSEGLANINSIAVSGMGVASGKCGDVTGIVDCNDIMDQTIIEVAKDGSGSYTTVQEGIAAASCCTPAIIRIAPGTYNEKIDVGFSHITLCGQTGREADTIITYNDSSASVGKTFNSYTVRFSADDISSENITFQNSYGDGSQAVALQVAGGERVQFRNCRAVARQDTLYIHSGSAYFKDCFIEGTVDFIFGGGTAVFDNCVANCSRNGGVYTAPNTDASVPYGLVFLGGHFTADFGVGGVWLGRPWGANGHAAFVNVEMDGHIEITGFTVMSGNNPAFARFREYNSKGDGANTWARSAYQMDASEAAQYTISNIYGGSWIPSFSQ